MSAHRDITSPMRSMTGYGQGVVTRGDVRATVDVRSVNHRFLDLKQRGSALPAAVEEAVATRTRAAVERGAVVVAVNVARLASGAGPRIDHDAAAAAHRQLAELAAALGIAGPDLALVLAQPGVLTSDAASAGEGTDEGIVADAVLAALDTALAQLAQMRLAEGAALAAELHGRIDELIALRLQVAERAAGVAKQLIGKLTERVQKLIGDVNLDPARLTQELALMADRTDITEELVRLASHLDQARLLIDAAGEAVGRRLDFLVQEIGRELNTIGSKSATAEITTVIVTAKATLEKIREQVQNVL